MTQTNLSSNMKRPILRGIPASASGEFDGNAPQVGFVADKPPSASKSKKQAKSVKKPEKAQVCADCGVPCEDTYEGDRFDEDMILCRKCTFICVCNFRTRFADPEAKQCVPCGVPWNCEACWQGKELLLFWLVLLYQKFHVSPLCQTHYLLAVHVVLASRSAPAVRLAKKVLLVILPPNLFH